MQPAKQPTTTGMAVSHTTLGQTWSIFLSLRPMIEVSNSYKRKDKIINLNILFSCIFAEQGKTCGPINIYSLNRNFNF